MFVDEKLVQRMKETHPIGTRIILDHIGNDPRPIPDGTRGTVIMSMIWVQFTAILITVDI